MVRTTMNGASRCSLRKQGVQVPPARKRSANYTHCFLATANRLAAVAGASPNPHRQSDRSHVTDFHAQAWDPASTVVLLAGDVDVTEVCEMFDDMMEGWASTMCRR